jgi:hypothetical protein
MERSIIDFIVMLLPMSPIYGMYIVGLILALKYWRKHPKVSMLTSVAIGLMLIISVLHYAAIFWLPVYLEGLGYKYILKAIGKTTSLLNAFAFAILLFAIFVGRLDVGSTETEAALKLDMQG